MYAIGKATRYTERQVVDSHPFSNLIALKESGDLNMMDRYTALRVKSYSTYEQAKAATKIAKLYNPVGFVVVYVKERE